MRDRLRETYLESYYLASSIVGAGFPFDWIRKTLAKEREERKEGREGREEIKMRNMCLQEECAECYPNKTFIHVTFAASGPAVVNPSIRLVSVGLFSSSSMETLIWVLGRFLFKPSRSRQALQTD